MTLVQKARTFSAAILVAQWLGLAYAIPKVMLHPLVVLSVLAVAGMLVWYDPWELYVETYGPSSVEDRQAKLKELEVDLLLHRVITPPDRRWADWRRPEVRVAAQQLLEPKRRP